MCSTLSKHRSQLEAIIWECSHAQWKSESHNFWDKILVVSSFTGTQRNETLTNCVTTPCMDMKTIGIPPCTGTPGQPQNSILPEVIIWWPYCWQGAKVTLASRWTLFVLERYPILNSSIWNYDKYRTIVLYLVIKIWWMVYITFLWLNAV